MIGGGVQNSLTSGQFARLKLHNNDALGRELAVYALLCFAATNPPLVECLVEPISGSSAQVGGQNGGVAPLIANGPILPGIICVDSGVFTNSFTLTYAATGENWLTLGGAPIFTIPKGYMLSVYGALNSGIITASFIWGLRLGR